LSAVTSFPEASKVAADMLNVGSNTLFKILRQKNIFTADNIPLDYYRQQGLFKTELTAYQKGPVGKTHIKPMVSHPGYCFLSELLDDMEKNGQLLSGKQRRLPSGQSQNHNNVLPLRRLGPRPGPQKI